MKHIQNDISSNKKKNNMQLLIMDFFSFKILLIPRITFNRIFILFFFNFIFFYEYIFKRNMQGNLNLKLQIWWGEWGLCLSH